MHKNRKTVVRGPEKKEGWKIPKLWPGATVFLLGGGPSLNKVNFDLIKKRRVIAINNAYGDPVPGVRGIRAKYKSRDWVDIVFFIDKRWCEWHWNNLKEFNGLICGAVISLHNRNNILGFNWGRSFGLETRPRYISRNKSAGAAAISFAYHLGVKRVVLLGYDMRRVDHKPNWHDDHPAPNKNPYADFLKPFPYIAKDAKKLGLEIYNCTPGSAITNFPILTLEEFLEHEKNNTLDAIL